MQQGGRAESDEEPLSVPGEEISVLGGNLKLPVPAAGGPYRALSLSVAL